jgi:hypothetical protein
MSDFNYNFFLDNLPNVFRMWATCYAFPCVKWEELDLEAQEIFHENVEQAVKSLEEFGPFYLIDKQTEQPVVTKNGECVCFKIPRIALLAANAFSAYPINSAAFFFQYPNCN